MKKGLPSLASPLNSCPCRGKPYTSLRLTVPSLQTIEDRCWRLLSSRAEWVATRCAASRTSLGAKRGDSVADVFLCKLLTVMLPSSLVNELPVYLDLASASDDWRSLRFFQSGKILQAAVSMYMCRMISHVERISGIWGESCTASHFQAR